MNENSNNFSETVDNKVPEGIEYDIFSENTANDLARAESMNRDYLKHIYKEDMSFLNKEVRMTRTQYLHDINKLNTFFTAEKKRFYKYFVLITVVLLVGLTVGIWAWYEWYKCWVLYRAAYADFYIGNAVFTMKEIEGIHVLGVIYGALGSAALVLGVTQFGFFGYGYYKKLKALERYRNRSLDTLECRKKEAMLLGQYDASR
ncbi:MAG: hypothetical protein K2G60_05555 [Oscillospiraceae bacterium]|nr:hypothetical protein [Oscillospiraceae bacterium]